jgi:hypothetical protein
VDEEIFDDIADERASTNVMASCFVNNFLGPDAFEGSGLGFDVHPDSKETSQKTETSSSDSSTCLICGGDAGKHVHYGGQACYSCKAFFRRAVKDEAFKKFSCPTKSCKIDSKSWRSCKWCRFKKCIASGLKPSWVLDKTERKRRREKKTTTTTAATATSDTAMVTFINPATKGSSMVFSYTTDELMQIMTMANGVHRDLTRNLTRFYGKNPTLFGQITR